MMILKIKTYWHLAIFSRGKLKKIVLNYTYLYLFLNYTLFIRAKDRMFLLESENTWIGNYRKNFYVM